MAYRDFSDAKKFEEIDFTDDVDKFTQFVKELVAEGGGDGPEDVFGAIDRCAEMTTWSGKARVTDRRRKKERSEK